MNLLFFTVTVCNVSNIDGFHCFRLDRSKLKGGGMCIYTKQELCATPVDMRNVVANIETVNVKFLFNDQPVYLCCCYHLPVPAYKAADSINMLCCNVEYIMSLHQDAIIIAGDLNKLDCSKLENDCGLSQVVDKSTRGSAILDTCPTNRPDFFTAVPVIILQ